MAAESVNLATKILTKHVYVYILYANYLLLQKINTLTMTLWRIIIWDRYWDTGGNVTCTYTWYIIHLITIAVQSNTCTHTSMHTHYIIYLRKMFCGSDNCTHYFLNWNMVMPHGRKCWEGMKYLCSVWPSRISGMEWWNGILEWFEWHKCFTNITLLWVHTSITPCANYT